MDRPPKYQDGLGPEAVISISLSILTVVNTTISDFQDSAEVDHESSDDNCFLNLKSFKEVKAK